MKRLLPLLPLVALAVGACAPGMYTRAEFVYAEPPQYEYVVPMDQVVVVTREVLVSRGYVVFRIEEEGPNQIIWARRGDDEVVRVFVTPQGQRVLVRGLTEVRERDDRGRHRGWVRRDHAEDVIREVDGRMRRERREGH
ncbi:MAG TPA: hypothetical protein VEU55_09185 [Gemmatimonadales bacterium]|nr:hypothetical protein [Gemmatimonadales bacterium]